MLELGMTFSMEQLVIDNDIFGMVKKAMQGIPVTEETLAVESIQKVGIGNNFLALKQTRQLVDYPSNPMLLDRGACSETGQQLAQRTLQQLHTKR